MGPDASCSRWQMTIEPSGPVRRKLQRVVYISDRASSLRCAVRSQAYHFLPAYTCRRAIPFRVGYMRAGVLLGASVLHLGTRVAFFPAALQPHFGGPTDNPSRKMQAKNSNLLSLSVNTIARQLRTVDDCSSVTVAPHRRARVRARVCTCVRVHVLVRAGSSKQGGTCSLPF